MKRALVLGGGGSKGAYEIGVWKALNELDMKFDIVTGTSIGALIGVLYVQGDFAKAMDLWQHITVDDVIVNGVNMDMDIELMMMQKEKYIDLCSSYVHHKGADITPFIKMIDSMYDADTFFDSSIDFGCMTVNVSKLSPQAMIKKDMTKDNVTDYIMASASCFPAFPMKIINEERFIDGGYYDNVPIELARTLGAEEIVAVDLKSLGRNRIKTSQSDTIYIEPFVPLGSFLLFDHEQIIRNIQIGYQDTMKVFGNFMGYIYTFERMDEHRIEMFEECMKLAFNEVDTMLYRDDMKLVIKKVLQRELTKALKSYVEYEYSYMAIMEHIAFDFELDDIGVKSFSTLLDQVMEIADAHIDVIEQGVMQIKELLKNLKTSTSIEIICFIYHFLLLNEEDKNRKMELICAVFTDSFLKAYMLYAMKKHGTLKISHKPGMEAFKL